MITVVERWYLKDECQDRGAEIMQQMDDLVGPDAHADPGWAGHASFFHLHGAGGEFLMMYDWHSVESHRELQRREDVRLTDFYARYCSAPRDVSYLEALHVDVDGHDHGH